MITIKKTLIALGALSVTACAIAQSNITLFGVVDSSVARIKTDTASNTGLASGGLASSRLGFRGVEDLGGGLAAGFWLEAGLSVDNGNSSGFSFDRRSTVSLSSSSLGEVRIGRDKSPAYLNIETFDPFADIGVGGYYASNMLGNATAAAGTPEGSAPKRASNSVQYVLPKLGGFYGQVMYAFGEQLDNVPNDRLRNSAALRFGYAEGPLNVAFGHGQIRGGTTVTGVDYKSTNLGASYDLGLVKPMFLFASERSSGRRIDMYGIGATVPFGSGELRATLSTFNRKDADDADSKKFALGYGYNLSRRTQIYGSISRVNNDASATRGLAVSSSSLANPSVRAGSSVTGYELGLRHSF